MVVTLVTAEARGWQGQLQPARDAGGVAVRSRRPLRELPGDRRSPAGKRRRGLEGSGAGDSELLRSGRASLRGVRSPESEAILGGKRQSRRGAVSLRAPPPGQVAPRRFFHLPIRF